MNDDDLERSMMLPARKWYSLEQPDALQIEGDKVVIIDHKFDETVQPCPRIDRVSMVSDTFLTTSVGFNVVASDELGSYKVKDFRSTRTKAQRKAQRIARKKNRRHK